MTVIHHRRGGLDISSRRRYPRALGRAAGASDRGRHPGSRAPHRRPFATLTDVTPRRLASASLALAAALSLGACATRSPMQTAQPYSAGDGVPVDLGSVQIRGLVVVSQAKGQAGALVGQVVNNTGKAVTLTFQVEKGQPVTVDAQPGSTTLGNDTKASLASVDVIPGAALPVAIGSDAGGTAQASVPVLAPTGYYSTITPATVAAPAQPTPQQ